MKFLPILTFLVLNFLGLYWGGKSTGAGVTSEWYAELDKAPWTPPGWVFGVAWTVVMVGFSWFMAGIWRGTAGMEGGARTAWMVAFVVAWILNVLWNPVFFAWHQLGAAMAVLLMLTLCIVGMAWKSHGVPADGQWRWGVLPYVVWLGLACSLNLYAWVKAL
jgi:tryptophan-rich sensory protein